MLNPYTEQSEECEPLCLRRVKNVGMSIFLIYKSKHIDKLGG